MLQINYIIFSKKQNLKTRKQILKQENILKQEEKNSESPLKKLRENR